MAGSALCAPLYPEILREGVEILNRITRVSHVSKVGSGVGEWTRYLVHFLVGRMGIGACLIELSIPAKPSRGVLHWWLTPGQLRAMGKRDRG